MKATILSLLLATTAVPAMAADMPVKAPPQAVVQTVGTWTGFYVFGFGGYSSGKISPDDFDVSEKTDGELHNPKPKGGVFGFGGGYNWQYGRFVGGVEVDYGFSSEKDNQSACAIPDGNICFLTVGLNSKIDALGSARVRAGFLLGDSFLLYGTGGLGFARSQATVTATFPISETTSRTLSASAHANNFGWVAGAGGEYKLMQNLRIRAEYLHYDFGSTTYAFQTPFILGVNVNAKTTDDVVRGALIWSFN